MCIYLFYCAKCVRRSLLLLIPCIMGQSAPAQVGPQARLKNIAEGYRANRESFGFFTCRFEARFGKAKSLEEACEKGVTQIREKAEGLWIVDGAKCLFEIHRSEDSKVQPTERDSGNFGVGLSPTYILDDGSIVLKYDLLMGAGAVLTRETGVVRPEVTPWDCIPYVMSSDGRGHPAGVVEKWLEGSDPVELEEERILDGLKLTSLVVTFQGGYRTRMVVDPDRGYLPIETATFQTSADGKEAPRTVGRITHIRKCSHDRWFPERCVLIWLSTPGTVTVKELKVTELNVDARPAQAAFRLTLPAGLRLHDGVQLAEQLKITKETGLHADDLPALLQSVKTSRRAPPSSGPGFARIAGIIGGAIFLLLSIVILFRKRGKAVRDPACNR